jgi:hypothetical protein
LSVARSLPEIHPNFIQDCPLCGRSNRIVVHGLWVLGERVEKHPDMGYSFCNCKSIFYTRKENVLEPASYEPDENGVITLPDPFFAWPDPYVFKYWDVRKYEILWDMYSLCEHLTFMGHKVVSAKRDFDVQSNTPQHFHIQLKTGCPLNIRGVSASQAVIDERNESEF